MIYQEKKLLVILSGAGMSAESGISTFRDSNGLWENYRIEEVATPEAWQANPDLVTSFYNLRRKQIIEASPNACHAFLKSLETYYDVHVITQNIDDLHERARSLHITHLHGNIRYAKSSGPHQENKLYPIDGWELGPTDLCDDGYRLRPHVVWFGEAVPMMDVAVEIVKKADILLVIGTSLNVYPAAGLSQLALHARKKIVVDPNASNLQVPHDFIKINETAVAAIPFLKKYLLD
jgi:NAD-dependent deacetylase